MTGPAQRPRDVRSLAWAEWGREFDGRDYAFRVISDQHVHQWGTGDTGALVYAPAIYLLEDGCDIHKVLRLTWRVVYARALNTMPSTQRKSACNCLTVAGSSWGDGTSAVVFASTSCTAG